jgi:hypothetical protein
VGLEEMVQTMSEQQYYSKISHLHRNLLGHRNKNGKQKKLTLMTFFFYSQPGENSSRLLSQLWSGKWQPKPCPGNIIIGKLKW